MAGKLPVINLIDWRPYREKWGTSDMKPDQPFEVDSIHNSTRYIAGKKLTEEVVKELIHLGWLVKIRKARNSDF